MADEGLPAEVPFPLGRFFGEDVAPTRLAVGCLLVRCYLEPLLGSLVSF
jgi:hypothetical protein